MPNLFPIFEMPSAIADTVAVDSPSWYPAPLFDIERGEFISDGARRPLYGDGVQGWVLWCTKTVLTQRWAHHGYSSNGGIEAEEAFLQPTRKAQESAFERTITEALLADPYGRTTMVKDFIFEWFNADSLGITFRVFGEGGQSALLTVPLSR